MNQRNKMKPAYRLKMKYVDSDNTETVRIYNMVNDACERFNIYLMDFFETLDILEEKKRVIFIMQQFYFFVIYMPTFKFHIAHLLSIFK